MTKKHRRAAPAPAAPRAPIAHSITVRCKAAASFRHDGRLVHRGELLTMPLDQARDLAAPGMAFVTILKDKAA